MVTPTKAWHDMTSTRTTAAIEATLYTLKMPMDPATPAYRVGDGVEIKSADGDTFLGEIIQVMPWTLEVEIDLM